VLYLMRPHLFPILDSHLISFYRSAARTAAIDVAEKRPSLGRFKTLHWEAIRRDILGSHTALEALRQVLARTEMKLAHEAGRRLSDLRLLDILAWAAAPEQSAAPRPAPAE